MFCAQKLQIFEQNKNEINKLEAFLISSFRRVLYVLCFLLGNSLACGVYTPTFRNRQSVPKRRHINYRRRGITQKKAYNIQNTIGFWIAEDRLDSQEATWFMEWSNITLILIIVIFGAGATFVLRFEEADFR